MNNNLNLKIVGSGPTGLLLALALSKLNSNIYIFDLLTRDKLINKDKTYAITHSTRKILAKFNLWNKLNSYLYNFNSLSISDSLTASLSILTISDLDLDIPTLKDSSFSSKTNWSFVGSAPSSCLKILSTLNVTSSFLE